VCPITPRSPMLTRRHYFADTTLSPAGQDFTATFTTNSTAFCARVVASNPIYNLHTRIEIP
jgi:hypothetical protein